MASRNGSLLPSCDVLLLTVTSRETKALKAALAETFNKRPKVLHGERRTYSDYGVLGGAHVVHVQAEAGSSTPGGSSATVGDALHEISPAAIVMVGIAFGVDDEDQPLGTILVSKQLQSYNVQRVGVGKNPGKKRASPEVIMRGDKVTASIRLLSRLRHAEQDWNNSGIEFCLMMSGEALIDNVDYRKELEALCPEARGGEMEGPGLYAEAKDRAEWIIVKAVCDWADGNKRAEKAKNQTTAANSAAGFVVHALSQGGFSTTAKASEAPPAKVRKPRKPPSKKSKIKECLRTFKEMLNKGGYYEDWDPTVGEWSRSWVHWMRENLTSSHYLQWAQAVSEPKGGFFVKDVDRLDSGYARVQTFLLGLARVYD
jgi:nucleoside phosphorylase